jgi:hypothetical protein
LAADSGDDPGHSFHHNCDLLAGTSDEVIVNLRAEGGLVNSQNVVQSEEFIERDFGCSQKLLTDESRS